MQEIWKDIREYEGSYQVSNLGRVRSLRTLDKQGHFKILSIQNMSRGYQFVRLGKKTKMVHRLVAEAFIPNTDNLPDVKHLDEDLSNNIVYNLKWTSHSSAILYGNHYKRIRERPKKLCSDIWERPILQLSRSGKVIKRYDSVVSANRSLRRAEHSYGIIACLNGRVKTSGGYVWRYDIR